MCGEKHAPPPTKDVDMEQDTIGQDINISPAPFLPPSFSHPLSSLPHGVGLPPGCCALRLEEVEAGGDRARGQSEQKRKRNAKRV